MKKPIQTMYYVVSRAMARAIKEGRECDRGTMYGAFATMARAEAYREANGLRMVSQVVAK